MPPRPAWPHKWSASTSPGSRGTSRPSRGGPRWPTPFARKDAKAAAQLRDLLDLDPSFDRAFVTDAAAVEWVDEPPDPSAIGQDLSAPTGIAAPRRSGDTYVSGVGRRSGGKRIMTVAIATPIRDPRGGTAGYLVAAPPARCGDGLARADPAVSRRLGSR